MTPAPQHNYSLFMSIRSPFARRARLALKLLQVPFREEIIDVFEPTAVFLNASPLALAPALTDSQQDLRLSDSASILEYLHENHGAKIWPQDLAQRARQRMASTWAEGVMACTVAWFLETKRKQPDEDWKQEHQDNLMRTLEALNQEDLSVFLTHAQPTQAGWDLAVALEYIDLRLPFLAGQTWRTAYPNFVKVLEKCQGIEAFQKTSPPAA